MKSQNTPNSELQARVDYLTSQGFVQFSYWEDDKNDPTAINNELNEYLNYANSKEHYADIWFKHKDCFAYVRLIVKRGQTIAKPLSSTYSITGKPSLYSKEQTFSKLETLAKSVEAFVDKALELKKQQEKQLAAEAELKVKVLNEIKSVFGDQAEITLETDNRYRLELDPENPSKEPNCAVIQYRGIKKKIPFLHAHSGIFITFEKLCDRLRTTVTLAQFKNIVDIIHQ